MTETQEQNFTVVPIIPMKPLAEGKTRLGRQFNQSQRADLAAGMLRRVISAIKGASIELFWVIGGVDRHRHQGHHVGPSGVTPNVVSLGEGRN